MGRSGDVDTEICAWAWESSGCDAFGKVGKGCEGGVVAWLDRHAVDRIEDLERVEMERTMQRSNLA